VDKFLLLKIFLLSEKIGKKIPSFLIFEATVENAKHGFICFKKYQKRN